MQATASNLNKARSAQHEYLRGREVGLSTPALLCPCGGSIKWPYFISQTGNIGVCQLKCGHEFIYRQQYKNAAGEPVDEVDDVHAKTIRTVHCRRKMNGDYPFHIGELVTWWKDNAPDGGHKLNMPMDSPFYTWAEYTGHDDVFLVIGVDADEDRVLVTMLDGEKQPVSLNPVEAREITETTDFSYIGCFWVPIEYLESVSEWPYID